MIFWYVTLFYAVVMKSSFLLFICFSSNLNHLMICVCLNIEDESFLWRTCCSFSFSFGSRPTFVNTPFKTQFSVNDCQSCCAYHSFHLHLEGISAEHGSFDADVVFAIAWTVSAEEPVSMGSHNQLIAVHLNLWLWLNWR